MIYTYPNKILFHKLPEIDKKEIKNDTFSQIGSSMVEILRKQGGIGLSANQVGLNLRMCVTELKYDDVRIYINPRIVYKSMRYIKSEEACLSLPGCILIVNRHDKVTVKYEDVEGKTQEIEGIGLLSQCLQHEIDHLNGITLLDRVGEFHKMKAKKAIFKYKKMNGRKQ